ncbi:MAG: HIT family protein [bacterium]|nr:HIT family protein [bacterium]
MNKEDCIFCKIIKREVPSAVVFEDETAFAFLDINPVTEGHVLLIPKNHHANILETPDNLVQDLFLKAKHLMPAVKDGAGSEYVAISVVGTDVAHFHIHLIPRSKNDGLKGFWNTKKYESLEKMNEVAEKIKLSVVSL